MKNIIFVLGFFLFSFLLTAQNVVDIKKDMSVRDIRNVLGSTEIFYHDTTIMYPAKTQLSLYIWRKDKNNYYIVYFIDNKSDRISEVDNKKYKELITRN